MAEEGEQFVPAAAAAAGTNWEGVRSIKWTDVKNSSSQTTLSYKS